MSREENRDEVIDEMYQEEKMKKKMSTVPYMLWTIFELYIRSTVCRLLFCSVHCMDMRKF